MSDALPLLFADLDDTLFQSRRKMDEALIHQQAAVAGNGDPRKSSFMTIQQAAMFDWLSTTTELIPVTARSGDAFDRVALTFPSWAILSNGALIREPDGTIHAGWADKMQQTLAPLMDTMTDILQQGRDAAIAADIDVRSWIVEEEGLATYVVFKLNVVTPDSLQKLHDLPMPVDTWTRHFNSETLAMIPPGSGKTAATEYLHGQLNPKGVRPTLGFGDSLSDLTFMKTTDILMIPTHSQAGQTL